MKLKEYLDYLNKLITDDPEVLDYTVVFAKDDVGNTFQIVVYRATIGKFEGQYSGDFTQGNDLNSNEKCNAICIN